MTMARQLREAPGRRGAGAPGCVEASLWRHARPEALRSPRLTAASVARGWPLICLTERVCFLH